MIKNILKLMRPKQWLKNFFVFAAMIFSGNLINSEILRNNLITYILFCLISSSVYVLNDIVDVDKDKVHPQKKCRPIASGEISIKGASIFDVFLVILTFLIAFIFNYKILIILLIYFITNILYSLKLKNIVIVDVMIITFGFVLRIESGSIASKVEISPWLILCTILLSLFLALNKRKSEITMLSTKGKEHRKILEEYSIELIDNMLTIITPSILMAYCLYTFSSIQSRAMMLTIPFVLYGIFRYQYLMLRDNIGSKPEDVFSKDMPFLIDILLWIVTVIAIIYFRL